MVNVKTQYFQEASMDLIFHSVDADGNWLSVMIDPSIVNEHHLLGMSSETA